MCFELKEMLKLVLLWLNCYNFRGWPTSTWQASPEQGLPALAKRLLRNLFYTSKSEGHYFGLLEQWSLGRDRKQESSSQGFIPQVVMPLTLSLSLHTGRYQSRRLYSSSDELPGFVWWRKFMCSTSESILSLSYWRSVHLLLSCLSYDYNLSAVVLVHTAFLFVCFLETRPYHSSVKYRNPTSPPQDADRNFATGIRSKEIISKAMEAGLNISVNDLWSKRCFGN